MRSTTPRSSRRGRSSAGRLPLVGGSDDAVSPAPSVGGCVGGLGDPVCGSIPMRIREGRAHRANRIVYSMLTIGPRGIREQSLRFYGDGRGYYDPQVRRRFLEHEMAHGRLVDVGDADVLPTNVVDTFHNVTAMTRQLLDRGALPLVLGGDHAISFPVVRAYGEPLHVV